MKQLPSSPLRKRKQKVLRTAALVSRRFVKKYSKPLRLGWDFVQIGVIGLNSFLLLLFREHTHRGINLVICFGAGAYVLILLVQALLLRNQSSKRLAAAYQTKKMFRLIYTALYLTAIMLDVIQITAQPAKGYEINLACDGILFLWVLLWGTNGLWWNKAVRVGKAVWAKRKCLPK